jgi:hypothetical protein
MMCARRKTAMRSRSSAPRISRPSIFEKFKRSLAWAILSTTDTEYWQWLPKKPFRKSRKTA